MLLSLVEPIPHDLPFMICQAHEEFVAKGKNNRYIFNNMLSFRMHSYQAISDRTLS